MENIGYRVSFRWRSSDSAGGGHRPTDFLAGILIGAVRGCPGLSGAVRGCPWLSGAVGNEDYIHRPSPLPPPTKIVAYGGRRSARWRESKLMELLSSPVGRDVTNYFCKRLRRLRNPPIGFGAEFAEEMVPPPKYSGCRV